MANKPTLALAGPRLVDEVIRLLSEQKMSGETAHLRYGIGKTWIYDVRHGRVKTPSADVVQMIYEDLTGQALVKE